MKELVSKRQIYFYIASLINNALSLLIPVYLLSLSSDSDAVLISNGFWFGVIAFSTASYGMEQGLLRVSVQKKGDVKETIIARAGILFLCFCFSLILFDPTSSFMIFWVAMLALISRGWHDYNGSHFFLASMLLGEKALILVWMWFFYGIDGSSLFYTILGMVVIRGFLILISNFPIFSRYGFSGAFCNAAPFLKKNAWLALTVVIVSLIGSVSPIVLGKVGNELDIVNYFVSYQMVYVIPVIFGYVARLIHVRLYKEDAANAYSLGNVALISGALTLVYFLFLILIKITLVDSQFLVPIVEPFFWVLVMWAWQACVGGYITQILLKNGKDGCYFLTSSLSSVVSIVLAIALVPRLGALGAAFALLLGHGVGVWMNYYVAIKRIG